MKLRIAIAALVCSAPLAIAQGQQLTPESEAMQQRIISCTGDALQWQTQAIAEKRRADDLQKQLDALKKPEQTHDK